jgi:ribonuclease HI
VRNFGVISRPLTELLKKGVLYIWTKDHDVAFNTLKRSLSTAPVLSLPDFNVPFCIETDASGTGIGAVLMQRGHPLAYLSKALGPRSQGLSTHEKEYMAILTAIDQWRHYLQHGEFHIFTDQKSLVQLPEQRLHTQWQKKVFTKLLGLQYKIVYKQGVEDKVADALSRRSVVDTECIAIPSCSLSWLEEVVATYAEDQQVQDIITKLTVQAGSVPNFTFNNGLLRYKNRVWIGKVPALQTKLMAAFHDSAVGGHSGVPVIYKRLKQLFAWQGMKTTVHTFVKECLVCQQAKPDRAKLPGLLEPLPVPTMSWQVISMDFVEGLPKSAGYNCVLVVVDLFSKYAHFLPLYHPFTAMSVAKAFHNSFYKLHGMPSSIISDRYKIFSSKLWKEMFKLADVNFSMSSAYHPQYDGQTERVNQCMETFLRCFVHACPTAWYQWLELAEYWYNTCPYSATGKSPFHVLYGYEPRNFGISVSDAICHFCE